MLRVLGSWLGERKARVVVDGCHSDAAALNNMVHQDTVWGPPLWNTFSRMPGML